MKFLKILGGIFLVLVLGFVALNMYAGAEYDVSRTVEINAPVKYPYKLANDLTEWESWSPWYEMDTAMQVTYGEKPEGAGAW